MVSAAGAAAFLARFFDLLCFFTFLVSFALHLSHFTSFVQSGHILASQAALHLSHFTSLVHFEGSPVHLSQTGAAGATGAERELRRSNGSLGAGAATGAASAFGVSFWCDLKFT